MFVVDAYRANDDRSSTILIDATHSAWSGRGGGLRNVMATITECIVITVIHSFDVGVYVGFDFDTYTAGISVCGCGPVIAGDA